MDRDKIKVLHEEQVEFWSLERIEKILERFYLLPSIVPGREPMKRKIFMDSLTSCFVQDYYLGMPVPTIDIGDAVPMYEIIGKKFSI